MKRNVEAVKLLRELLITAESLYGQRLEDPLLDHSAIRDRLARVNTFLRRPPGCGPRALWSLYEQALRKGGAK